MKSLWIVNKCCGALHQHLYGKQATGGLWLDAALTEATQYPQDQVVVVNVEKIQKLRTFRQDNTSYYTIPGEPNFKYDYKSPRALAQWQAIMEAEKPDVMVIWGTEFPYGLAAMNAAPEIPAVIYIQGILESIRKYYTAGLTEQELKAARTLRDILTGTTIRQTRKQFERRTVYEQEMIRRAGHVILENQWSYSYLRGICPEVTAHIQQIPISEVFCGAQWQPETAIAHRIMCPAADYPVKGLHMLLKALRIVREQYPDVLLEIPGTKLNFGTTLKSRLKRKGYDKLICRLLKQYDLTENVVYRGRLTASEMAESMAAANCFVVSSAIENHSSTLKEAMAVGTPCIASYVGGIPEYARSGENALLYRFEDYEVLAQWILKTFEDPELCQKLSENARKTMSETDSPDVGYRGLRKILKEIAV